LKPWLAFTRTKPLVSWCDAIAHGTLDNENTLCGYTVAGLDKQIEFDGNKLHDCKNCAAAVRNLPPPVSSSPKFSDEEFVLAWQAARSMREFVSVTGIAYKTATERVRRLRRRGVRLKKMKHRPMRVDVEALNKICDATLMGAA
jgi:ribosome-binding protein aMBF1 (putative translation factor)